MKLVPYPEYKDAGVPWLNKVPKDWIFFRGKNVFKPLDIRSEKGTEELLSVSERHGVTPRKKVNVTMFQAASYQGYKLCWPGDLVINSLWAWMQGLGFSKYHGIISTAYGVYRPRRVQVSEFKYFDYLLRSDAYKWELRVRSKGIWRSRYQLKDDDFLTMPILVPGADEQTQIARFLDWKTTQINKFIRNKRRLIELLKEQKQNIINQAVTRGLDPNVKLKPSGVEWIGDIPGHWEMRKITHLYRQIGSGTTPQSGNADYYDGNIPWIISGDLTDGFLETTSKKVTDKAVQDYSTLKMYPEGSLVVAMYGATIGKVSLTSIRACTNQACCVLSNPRNDINNKFMLQLFLKIKPDLVRMGYGGGQPNISQDTIKGLRLPIPSIEEQGDIVTFIENETATIDYAITHAKREIELMREYRTRLISDVVTGQVDVRGIEVPDVAEDELLALVEDTGEADEVIDDEGEMDETD
jgi:type I restriction enzyme S subunit